MAKQYLSELGRLRLTVGDMIEVANVKMTFSFSD